MTIGKGLLKIDDLLKFSKTVDKLSQYCYMVNYVPSKDYIVISLHKKNLDKLKKDFGKQIIQVIETKKRKSVMVFAKIKWR